MSTRPTLAHLAALLGEPAPAAMLQALLAGAALTAGELARAAGIGAPAASAHLARLVDGGVLAVHRQGRHHYHRLASEEIAAALGTLGTLAAAPPRHWPHGEAFRAARLCYDHLAGRLGVALHAALTGQGLLVPAPGGWMLSTDGTARLAALGADLAAAATARRFACDCMDWSERRPHLAGGLAGAIAQCCLERGWLVRGAAEPENALARRRLTLTPEGARALRDGLGLAT